MTERGAAFSEQVSELELAVRRLVDRSRRWPPARWRRLADDVVSADSGRSAADAVQALVTRLAELEHAVEIGPGQQPAAWRTPTPPPYPGGWSDRLAVVGSDLVAALRIAPQQHQVWYADELVPLKRAVGAVLAHVKATAAEIP